LSKDGFLFSGIDKLQRRRSASSRRGEWVHDLREPSSGRLHAIRICCSVLVLALFVACGGDQANDRRAPVQSTRATTAIAITDDAGNVVRLQQPAKRIISLIPSATETLIAIGAGKQIIGRTRYDVAPEIAALPSVGGGVDPSVEAIVGLHPDLVVAWESDKRQAIRQKLIALNVPVFILRTQDTTDIFRGISNLGRLTAHDSAAAVVAASVHATLREVEHKVAGRRTPSVFYVVYNDPPMTTGPHTFIGELISLAGGRSIFSDSDRPWPSVAMEEIVRRDPDIVVVPVGQFRTNSLDRFRKLAGWRDLRAVREGHVVTVPADLVSRPSPSIAASARVLMAAFHPELSPDSTSLVDTAAAASVATAHR
jgi:iron complex transport system substrate-binding protein